MKLTKKRVILCALAAIMLVGAVCLAFYLKSVADYKQAVADITFQNKDITRVADGIYIGECNVGFIAAKVEVTMQKGQITGIEILEHRHERGKAAEAVIDKMIEEQKIEVDAVSGATNSSIVLKKAVENALMQKD